MEYLNLVFRSIFFYFLIILYLRIMGKREVGELSVFDLVLYFLMTELLAISISSTDESVFKTIVPVTTLAILQIFLSLLMLKKKKIRDAFDGTPAIVIQNGVVNQNEMRKNRYTIDDLMFQIRARDVGSVSEVEFAILENNGSLSVLKKAQTPINFPFPLISDGEIQNEMLSLAGVNRKWLLEKLHKNNYEKIEDIFLCIWEKSGLFIILKKEAKDAKNMHYRSGKHSNK